MGKKKKKEKKGRRPHDVTYYLKEFERKGKRGEEKGKKFGLRGFETLRSVKFRKGKKKKGDRACERFHASLSQINA